MLAATGELRLDPTVVDVDRWRFEAAMRRGAIEEAVDSYSDKFQEGFHLLNAPDFERWIDGERAELAQRYPQALEQLAAAAYEFSAAQRHAIAYEATRKAETGATPDPVVLRAIGEISPRTDRSEARSEAATAADARPPAPTSAAGTEPASASTPPSGGEPARRADLPALNGLRQSRQSRTLGQSRSHCSSRRVGLRQ